MAKRSKRKDNNDPPMPRSALRESRPSLPDPDDEAPDSDSLRVLHYQAVLRLGLSFGEEAPIAPILDEILFETSLVGTDDPLDKRGTLHAIVTHRKDEHLTTWFAVSGEEDDERSSYVAMRDDDFKFLYKTIFYDYPTDHPNVMFYLPLDGPRVRREIVDTSSADNDMLWYWFDVLDLKYRFQIGAHPSFDFMETATVSAKLDDVLALRSWTDLRAASTTVV